MSISLQPSCGQDSLRKAVAWDRGLDNKFYVTLESYLSSEFPRLLTVPFVPLLPTTLIFPCFLYRRNVCRIMASTTQVRE
jgi:hypothetical protein